MKAYTFMIYRSLLRQPKRALLTIISIFLAVALMSSTSVLAASLHQTQLNQAIALTGNFHGTFNNLSQEQVNRLNQDRDISAVGSSAPLGSYTQPGLNLTLEGFDKTALDMFNFNLLDGRLPENPGEIALEAWALDLLGPQMSLGETIHLSYFLYEASDQNRMRSGESVESDFVLVGILSNITAAKLSGVSLGLISQSTVQAQLPPASIRYTAFVKYDVSPAAVRSTHQRLREDLGLDENWATVNDMVVNTLESGSGTVGPILLLAVVILAASSTIIYNNFQISVTERMRQFGMLRAIGATPMQIAVLVIGEAHLLSLAAIPLGILAGVGSAALLAQTLTLLQSAIGIISVPLWSLVVSALVGQIAVLVSAFLPALFAARISPMAAIRNVDGRGKAGRVEPSILKRLPASVHGQRSMEVSQARLTPLAILPRMAYDNVWRSRSRSLVTIFSLGFGILLTILFGIYAAGMDADSVVKQFLHGSYAVKSNNPMPNNGFPEEVAQMIERLPGVENVIKTRLDDLNYSLLPLDRIDEEQRKNLERAAQQNPAPEGIAEPGLLPVPSQVFGYGLDILASLSEHVLEGEIDPAVLALGKYTILVDPQGVFGLHPGDELTLKKVLWDAGQTSIHAETFRIAAIVSEPPVYMGYSLVGPRILLAEEVFKAYTGSSLYKRFDIDIGEHVELEALERNLQGIATTIEGGSMMSYEEMRQGLEKEKRDLLLMVYSLVGTVTLIGVANIVNTLTTNLILRTREFGTLRAIGMTESQLKAVTRLEGLFYGFFSSVWGVSAGVLLGYFFVQMMAEQGSPQFVFPWPVIILASLSGPTISILSTVFPTRRISRLSIIESLQMVD
jgi:putative ABC transport system permease protein